MQTKQFLLTSALALGLGCSLAQAAADWPSQTLKLVVGFPAGSSPDLTARALAEPLGKALGQTFIVENRAGAGGNIGGAEAVRSAPDGYNLAVTNMGAISINPAIYAKLSFDPLKDFAPVANIGAQDIVLMVLD